MPALSPVAVAIDPATGVGEGFAEHYVKRFGELVDIYADVEAARALDADGLAYEVYSNARTSEPGALVFGTSVLSPVLVGDEFSMTRGHLHSIVDRAEVYHCLAGVGVLLMEDLQGRTQAQAMTPGDVVYVPGGWVHRSVNVGDGPLVTLFCFAGDAGQDYAIIERAGGMAMRVVTDGHGGWRLTPNPAYIPRQSSR